MKYNTAQLLLNLGNIKLQMEPVNKGIFDWQYIEMDKFTNMYNFENIKSSEIKVHSEIRLKERPKSAGFVLKQPNTKEGIIKKANSLCNIEDFFLKRRIPLIKPLISEREILKLQLMEEQCRNKHTSIGLDSINLQKFDFKYTDISKYYKSMKCYSFRIICNLQQILMIFRDLDFLPSRVWFS